MEKFVCIFILVVTLIIGNIAIKRFPSLKSSYSYYVYTYLAIAAIIILGLLIIAQFFK